jgi:hypothetical protein
MGDNGCTTTALDGTRCYAPAGSSGAYTGIDITGTLAGTTWNFDTDRAVVGWAVNPAYGPIPTMQLSYVKPATTVTATDRWDDQCPSLAAGGRCTLSTAAVPGSGAERDPVRRGIRKLCADIDCQVRRVPAHEDGLVVGFRLDDDAVFDGLAVHGRSELDAYAVVRRAGRAIGRCRAFDSRRVDGCEGPAEVGFGRS